MSTTAAVKMPGTPRPWMNTAMRTMMHVPGVRHFLGKTFATITVIGARTGTYYKIPIQYFRVDDEIVVLSQKHRVWWRNIRRQPNVELLMGAHSVDGRARVLEGDDARPYVERCLDDNPRMAKFYEILRDDGTVDPAGVDALLHHMVAIVIS